jgi:hypothetical protein
MLTETDKTLNEKKRLGGVRKKRAQPLKKKMLRRSTGLLVRSLRASAVPAPRFARSMASKNMQSEINLDDFVEEDTPETLAEKEKQHHAWIAQSIQLLKHAAVVAKLPPGAKAPAPPALENPVQKEVLPPLSHVWCVLLEGGCSCWHAYAVSIACLLHWISVYGALSQSFESIPKVSHAHWGGNDANYPSLWRVCLCVFDCNADIFGTRTFCTIL